MIPIIIKGRQLGDRCSSRYCKGHRASFNQATPTRRWLNNHKRDAGALHTLVINLDRYSKRHIVCIVQFHCDPSSNTRLCTPASPFYHHFRRTILSVFIVFQRWPLATLPNCFPFQVLWLGVSPISWTIKFWKLKLNAIFWLSSKYDYLFGIYLPISFMVLFLKYLWKIIHIKYVIVHGIYFEK